MKIRRMTIIALTSVGIVSSALAAADLFITVFLTTWQGGVELSLQRWPGYRGGALANKGEFLFLISAVLLAAGAGLTVVWNRSKMLLLFPVVGFLVLATVPALLMLGGTRGIVGDIVASSVSPEGERVAYVVQNFCGFETTNEFLFVQPGGRRLEHSMRERLIARIYCEEVRPEVEVRWSPDGRHIAARTVPGRPHSFQVFDPDSRVKMATGQPEWW